MELLLHLIAGSAGGLLAAMLVWKLQSRLLAAAVIVIASALFIILSYMVGEMIGIQFVISGAVFGYTAKRFSFQQHFMFSVLALWFVFLIVYYLMHHVKGIDVVSENYKIIQDMVSGSSVSVADKALMMKQLENFYPTMRVLMPFSYFFSSVIISLLVYVMAFPIFVRLKFLALPDGQFSLFRVNEWIVYLLTASWLTVLLAGQYKFIWGIALNIGLILCLIYTIQGLAVISHFFERKQWPKIYGILLILFAVVLGFQVAFFVLTMLMGIGVIDFWMNFRKIT